jgi:deoxyadenosine/deoxycytidine kinase
MKAGEEILSRIEFNLLDEWFKEITKEYNGKIDLIVHILSKPKIAFERMKIRQRSEEKDVSFELIKKLHSLHENWLTNKLEYCPAPVLVLDADKDLNYMKNEAFKVLKLLRNLKPSNTTNEIESESEIKLV